ncbi:hypothetical protein HOLleu_29697 [Holothuria leucospilota]|uniref:Secreted protein n=1 Tax=Holothuria leucospilota TaxID=206669 RepID=A0A9Q1BJB9_HOLLE|nr:hypothetical protein HOLleu_29697 [Holothuria leucospilota]
MYHHQFFFFFFFFFFLSPLSRSRKKFSSNPSRASVFRQFYAKFLKPMRLDKSFLAIPRACQSRLATRNYGGKTARKSHLRRNSLLSPVDKRSPPNF